MRSPQRSIIGVLTVAVAMMAAVAPAQADVELWETDETSAQLGANLQMISAYVDMRSLEELRNLAPLIPEWEDVPLEAGLGGAVGRLEWSAQWGDRISLDVHNRVFWQASTLPQELIFQGFEVSRGDDRRLDTQWELVDRQGVSLTHDIDRAVVGLYLDAFDLYLGRQAIRWGLSDTFPVADRFAPLSPFELDTIQRRGIDAARLVTDVSRDVELDVIVADRGPDEPLALGARAEYFGLDFDAYGGFGRFWQRLSAMAGMTWLFDYWRVFGEAEALWDLEDDQLDRPRATAGVRRMGMDWQLGLEYHYNGFGVAPGNDYGGGFDQPEVTRGETYFVGRHFVGGDAFYFFDNDVAVGGGVIANVVDPSAVMFPTVRYELEDRFSVGAGAYVGIGDAVEVDEQALFEGQEDGGVSFPSEFGGVSDLYFVEMTAYF